MQVVFEGFDFSELMDDENEPKRDGEYCPFTGRRVPVVSLDEIKRLLSSPKNKRRELLLDLSNNY